MDYELKIMKRSEYNQGFSTLELLLAMFIIILALSAVILVSFGSQTLLADSQTNAEALSLAQGMLENAQAQARKDFRLVNPASDVDGIYTKRVDVFTQADYLTKLVKATVNWTGEHNRPQSVQLSALVTNFENAVGGDTCDSVLAGNWQSPQLVTYNFGADLIGDPAGSYPITDIDVYKGKMYVTVNNPNVNSNKTFFIFDVSNPTQKPTLIGSGLDNSSVSAGLNAVRVAEDADTNKLYAYVANGYGASFTICSEAENCNQLQVIDVTDPNNPQVVKSLKIPSASQPFVKGIAGQAMGNSIFYKDGFVYLGLTKTASGPEFNIIDVHDPLIPSEITGGNFSVGNTVNAIFVRGKYVYIASPNNQELKILDISSPGSPAQVGGYDAAAGSGNGKSIFGVGDKMYLGRTVGDAEFFILDSSVPATAQLPMLASKPDVDDSINSLLGRDYLSFLLTNANLRILKTDNLTNISDYSTVALAGGAKGETMDCEGNYFFVGSNDASNKGYISVITAP